MPFSPADTTSKYQVVPRKRRGGSFEKSELLLIGTVCELEGDEMKFAMNENAIK